LLKKEDKLIHTSEYNHRVDALKGNKLWWPTQHQTVFPAFGAFESEVCHPYVTAMIANLAKNMSHHQLNEPPSPN
jgi:hypothetical protein